MGRGALGRVTEVLRTLLQREELGELPEAAAGESRPSILGMVVAREELALDPPAPSGRVGLLSWLLGAERLPADDAPVPSGRRSFLGTLFAGERLPEDEPPARGTGGRPGAGAGAKERS